MDARYPDVDYICELQRSTTSDDCIYVSTNPVLTSDDFVATGTHVDDLLTIGAPNGIRNLVSTLENDFELVIKKDPTVITAIQIERDRKNKWLITPDRIH